MNIISADKLYRSYGDKVLLDCVSFGMDEGDRIGLIGVNGAGKSTLLKLVAGVESPESGAVTVGGRAVVQYLPQEPVFDKDASVLDQVFYGDAPVMRVLRQYEEMLEVSSQSPLTGEQQARLLRLQSQLEAMDGWQLEHEAKGILTRLGVTDFQAAVGALSGGQRKRIALARALIQPADLLILDEPTNHIDNETVLWLETLLQKRKGALLMVTHDRYFLDRVVNRIFELDRGRLYQYPGNYRAFLENKLAREAQEMASEEKRQNFLRNEIEWIKRGPKARGTKQKARTDRYYEILEQTPAAGSGVLEWSAAASRLGNTVIELEDVTKAYGERVLIRDFSYLVKKRDRIGVVGPNGSGKSTLLKLLAGIETPDRGSVVIGATVKVGYFSQEHEELGGNQRVIEYIREMAHYVETADGQSISAAQMLERFLFPSSVQWTPIAKLSGGEKRRLALLRMLMSGPNVLLLDELTNDLDIPTLSVLESYLDDFPGAVIVVSHDRYFLDRVVENVFAFEGDGKISRYLGDFSDYSARLATASTAPAPPLEPRETSASAQLGRGEEERGAPLQKRTPFKLTFREQKEYEEIEDRIAEAEQSRLEIAEQMERAGGDYERVQALFADQQAVEARLNELLERWTYLSERVEEIEQSRSTR
ncbi:MAG: ABC-F family ATP-binding cassette domain-containing protein [Bacilli bacterium]